MYKELILEFDCELVEKREQIENWIYMVYRTSDIEVDGKKVVIKFPNGYEIPSAPRDYALGCISDKLLELGVGNCGFEYKK